MHRGLRLCSGKDRLPPASLPSCSITLTVCSLMCVLRLRSHFPVGSVPSPAGLGEGLPFREKLLLQSPGQAVWQR